MQKNNKGEVRHRTEKNMDPVWTGRNEEVYNVQISVRGWTDVRLRKKQMLNPKLLMPENIIIHYKI